MVTIETRYHQDYFPEITAAIHSAQAGDRIGLTTMNFDPLEERISTIVQELTLAAKRGVTVYLLVDAHAFMVDYHERATGPLLDKGTISAATIPEFQHKYQSLEQLAQAGGHYRVINTPRSRITVPVAGRSHIKTFVHNGTFYIGGCNLGRAHQIDCMVRIEDEPTADWIWNLITDTSKSGSMRATLHNTDQQLRIDAQTTLFIDAGKPSQSLILQQALNLIDEAAEYIFMTCQFFPNSTTATRLAQASRRGVRTDIYYNSPGKQTKLYGKIQQAVMTTERLRLPKELFAHELPENRERLHAKVIATDKGAIIGSHNYVMLGVRLGTAEVALVRRDPAFSQQLIQTLLPHIDSEITG